MDLKIEYSTNSEYREVLRKFCNMKYIDISNQYADFDIIDDETKDELLFDSNAMEDKMDEILEKTKGDLLWDELYELAAAKFFSTKKDIGIAVLFSYDYFPGFYSCWNSFNDFPEQWSNINIFYKTLKQQL